MCPCQSLVEALGVLGKVSPVTEEFSVHQGTDFFKLQGTVSIDSSEGLEDLDECFSCPSSSLPLRFYVLCFPNRHRKVGSQKDRAFYDLGTQVFPPPGPADPGFS